jgi:hypothetical protein
MPRLPPVMTTTLFSKLIGVPPATTLAGLTASPRYACIE